MERAVHFFTETKRNFLVLGRAGTGKSELIKHLLTNARKNVRLLAPTGLAALQIGGQTIHSFFGLEPGLQARTSLRLKSTTGPDEERQKTWAELDTLLIDEVSMVRADCLDAVDSLLRDYGPSPGEPFGGVQIGLFGDALQLPPIATANVQQAFNGNWREGWQSPWFFDAHAFRTGNFARVTLNRDLRPSERDPQAKSFVTLLNRVREGRLQPADFEVANSRVVTTCPTDALSLVTTNKAAKEKNDEHFGRLQGPVVPYSAVRENWPSDWREHEPVPERVEIKCGARVLVCANLQPGLVNGTVGIVIRADNEEVVIRIGTEERGVRRHTWEFPIWSWDGSRMVRTGTARYTQMPLKLAWALTVNKAQGQTIEGPVWVDLGRVWSGGQTYVALSRVRRLGQIHLKRPLTPQDVIVEQRAIQFLLEGDAPPTPEEAKSEIRKKAATIYRETRLLRDAALAEQEEATKQKKQAARILVEAKAILEECKQLSKQSEESSAVVSMLAHHIKKLADNCQKGETRVREAEERVTNALEQAKKSSWLKRFL